MEHGLPTRSDMSYRIITHRHFDLRILILRLSSYFYHRLQSGIFIFSPSSSKLPKNLKSLELFLKVSITLSNGFENQMLKPFFYFFIKIENFYRHSRVKFRHKDSYCRRRLISIFIISQR